jgi:carboxylesterase type B
MEIPFAFDNVKISARMTGGGADAMALADKVSDAWIAFARTGNPNTPKLPHWPAFDAKDRADHGHQQREQSGERSLARTAPRDVQAWNFS